MYLSVPNRGPQLDVVLIVFFINPCDLCKHHQPYTDSQSWALEFLQELFFASSLYFLVEKSKSKKDFKSSSEHEHQELSEQTYI